MMLQGRLLFLSAVFVILCSVQLSIECATNKNRDHHDLLERSVSLDNEQSFSEKNVTLSDPNDHGENEGDQDEEDEDNDIDVLEEAEGDVSYEEEDRLPVRYEGSQLWRINTSNVSNEDVIKIFESKYDGCVWKTKEDYVDIFLEKQRIGDARMLLKDFEIPYEVAMENVQSVIDDEKKEIDNKKKRKVVKRQTFIDRNQITWDNYYDLADIYGYMRLLSQKYPSICKLFNIGKTVEGRGMIGLRVSGPKSTRVIWVDGGIHAREWISPSAVMYIMDQFVRYWAKQPAHVRSATWYFLPVMNPDGYQYSRTIDRLWRKNRRNFGSCKGVDLNRNFDFKWTGVGASNSPCDMTYRGPKGLSEPEARAVADFLIKIPRKPVAYLTFHSYGQYILYPWGFASAIPSDHRMLKQVGLEAAESAKLINGALYTVAPAFQPFGAAAGGSDDWAKGHLKVKYVYTIELRDKGRHGFLLPTNLIRVTCREALTIVGTISKASMKTEPEPIYRQYDSS